jgi:putative PIN family toxin of toxin-antitoxin system
MAKPTVLLDTNIISSGLIFAEGKEHAILHLAEDERIRLIIPDNIIEEVRYVLARRFTGFQALFDLYLRRTDWKRVEFERIEPLIRRHRGKVRDEKDMPFFAAVVLLKPDFVVTGDRTLREDLRKLTDLATRTRVLNSSEFLTELKQI